MHLRVQRGKRLFKGARFYYICRMDNQRELLIKLAHKKMPFGKNLLVANYHGPYGEVHKAYTALENFKADHRLSSMAIPYQKFLQEGYDFSDDEIVQMKVYYPVF